MSVLALDTECNTWNKGNPYDQRFKAICYSWADGDGAGAYPIDEESISKLREKLGQCSLLVGFNWKYDLSVFRKLGIDLSGIRCFDCQLAEFVLTNQRERLPSLEGCLVKYELGHKVDVVKNEYWSKGIQTEDIPWPVLEEYATNDARKTYDLYLKQLELLSPAQLHLVNLMCMDLVVLQEMEWNGLKFNKELCNQRSGDIKTKISEILKKLSDVYPDVPINFNSGDQLSAFLYGGSIVQEIKVHDGFFKTGLRAGQPKLKKEEVIHNLPRIYTPLRGSELKKDGVWATNESTLQQLRTNKSNKWILDCLFELATSETLNQRYYVGLPKINEEMNWEPNYLHGQLNQCIAATGRLSATKPNQQNFSADTLDIIISRYDN